MNGDPTGILLVPSVRKGNGSGHLARCLSLAAAIGPECTVFLPDEPGEGCWSAAELSLAYPGEVSSVRVVTKPEPGRRFRLIVVDLRASEARDIDRWSKIGPLAGIDEGGAFRDRFAYLVDILPKPIAAGRRPDRANASSLGYLALPTARRQPPSAFKRVLVSFGGEDPARLASSFLAAAFASDLLDPGAVTVVSGALSSGAVDFPGVTAIGPVQDLKECLRSYDLVVTQFGLTAFEAAWAGCAVLILDPGRIHGRLTRHAGFASLGVRRPSTRRLRRFLSDPTLVNALTARAAPKERLDLAALLKSLVPRNAGACPACGREGGTASFRNARKTYFRCPECGLVSMTGFADRAPTYADHSYFFDEYKAQYGRTYLEDMPNLRRLAAARLDRIVGMEGVVRRDFAALDVGCAYGAFIAEAQARGWQAVGSDLSPEAVDYVRSVVGAPAFVADFEAPGMDGLYPRELDCLTMWYVIEHFAELGRVLRRVSSLLKPGGIFAFSTPSMSGVSARARPAAFWEKSPDDHYTVWSPGTVRGILKRYGFTVARVVVTGHHSERFPVLGVSKTGRILATLISKAFRLGDTFECYAIKDGDGKAAIA